MKRLLLFLTLLLAEPAAASIIVDLEQKVVYFKKDGRDTVIINDGETIVRIDDPEAGYPRDGEYYSTIKNVD